MGTFTTADLSSFLSGRPKAGVQAQDPTKKTRQQFTTSDLNKFLASQQKPPIQRAVESIPGVKNTEKFAQQQAKYWTDLKDRTWGTPEHRGPLQKVAQDFSRSKEWQQLNTPFYADPRATRQAELHRQFHDRLLASKEHWSTPHQLLQAAIEGVGDQINGLFTPVNAALLLGLEGLGAEGKAAIASAGKEAEAAEGLRLAQRGMIRDEASMKAAEKAARAAGQAAARDMEERIIASTPLNTFTAQRALQGLASVGFSAQMLSGVKPAFEQAEAAFKQGDVMQGTRSAIDAVSGLVFGLGSAAHAVGEGGAIRREWRNEADVRRTLDAEAKEKYGKSWQQLDRQEKAEVTYGAVSKYGPEEQRKFYRTIQGMGPAPVSDELTASQDRFMDDQARLDERAAALAEVTERPLPNMNADDAAYEKGAAEREAWQKRQQEVQAKIDSREPLEVRDRIIQGEAPPLVPPKPLGFDERRNARGLMAVVPSGKTRIGDAVTRWRQKELEAIPAPPRTGYTPQAAPEFDFGQQPMTPLEREVARDEDRRQKALRELEDERALQAKEARGIEEQPGEEPQESPGIPHVERRSVRDMAQIEDEIRRSIPQAPEIRSVEEHGYERMTEDLRRLGHDLYPEDTRGVEPAMVYERLRRKAFEGDILHNEEERFMSLYARRRQVEKTMIDKGSREAASKLFDGIVRADVQRIMSLATREGKMFDVAFDLQREAMRARTMEDADFWALQSNVALDTAERLRAQREAEQAKRTAMLDPDQFVPNDTPIYKLRGSETEIVLPDRRRVKAYYAAVPVNRLIPSHDPLSWEWNEKYKPRKMQIRDLSVEEEARAETMRMGNNFDSEEYLSDTQTADHGPSIISEDGRVIGGNRRMLAQLLSLNTEQRAKVIQAMVRGAKKFNVPVDDRFFDEDFPMTIVRVVKQMPEAAAEAIRLGHDMNRDYIQGFNADAKAVVDATRLTMDDMETISRWMEQLPGDEESQSVTKLLATRPQEVFNLMVEKGIIPPNKTVEYMREGKLTDRAMETFKNLIRGKVVDDANLLMLSKEARLKAVDRAIVPLLKIKQLTPEWNISDYFKRALRVWIDIDRVRDEIEMVGKAGDSAVDRYYHPEDFKDARGFSGAPLLIPRDVHPITLALAKLMEQAPLRFKEALWAYADEGEGKQVRLLEAATPVDSFNQHIGEKVGVEVSPVDWGTLEAASEERKDAFEAAEKKPPKATKAEQEKAERPLEPNTEAVVQQEMQKLQAATENGTVTPEALQQFFEADPRFRDMAPTLMHIFGRVIPGMSQMTLPEFLGKVFQGFEYTTEEEFNRKFGEGLFQEHGEIQPPPTETPKRKGAITLAEDGRRVIHLFEGAQVSTVLHEFFHAMRPYMNDADTKTLAGWGYKELEKRGVKPPPGKWTRDMEEILARAWERYWWDGKAPDSGLAEIFARLKSAMRSIYLALTGRNANVPRGTLIDVKLSKDVRGVFDRWIAGEEMKPPESLAPPPLKTEKPEIGKSAPSAMSDEQLRAEREAIDPYLAEKRYANRAKYIDAEVDKRDQQARQEAVAKETVEPPPEEVPAPVAQPEQMELIAPPESIETDITPEERESLQPAFFGPKHANEVEGEQRLKRTMNLAELQDWAIKNKDRLKGMTAWTLPDGRAVAYYVPEDPTVLFQGGETLMDLYRELHEVRDARQRIAKRNGPVQNLDRQIADLEGRIDKMSGAPRGAVLGMAAPPVQKLVTPGETERGKIEQPIIKPEQTNLFRPLILPETREEEAPRVQKAEQPRTVPDDTVRVQDRGGAGGGDRPAGRPDTGQPEPRGVSTGRRPGEPVPGRRDLGANTLSKAVPVNLASPLRRADPPIVEREAWRRQLEDAGMPTSLPPITHRVSDDIRRVLIFAGQPEVADSAYSALHVFDGTVVSTPTGTGKSFTGTAIAKQFYDDGQKKILIVSKNPSILKQKNGWKDVAERYFGWKLKDLPRTAKEIGDEPYSATYQGLLRNPWAAEVPWDLIVFDESAEARRWYDSAQGDMARRLSDSSKKAVYISATPFHNAVEYGYMTKLGLWNPKDLDVPNFDTFARQFGAIRNIKGGWARLGGEWPNRLLKLREQLIERGQFITQNKDYRGNTSQFALVPLSQKNKIDLMRGQQAFMEAENFFNLQQNPGLAGVARRVAVTWTKNYIERARLTQVTDMMRAAAKRGWQVVLFSENTNAREEVYDFMKQADAAMDGRLSHLLPPFEGVRETLTRDLGEPNVSNFTGPDNAERRTALKDFLDGKKQFLFASYGAGSTGLNLHDDSKGGQHPRMAIYLGPPYSGIMFEQSQGRLWRFGTTSDVHNIFMTSDAGPELHMLLTKIAPRLESLKAAVNGVDGTDPLIERLKAMKDVQEDTMRFEVGREVDFDAKKYVAVEDKVPIANWMEALQQIPDGSKAKGEGRGMRFKGREEMEAKRKAEKQAQFRGPQGQVHAAGVEFTKLFQDDGSVNPQARFVPPDEARASEQTRADMNNLVEGDAVPVAGEELKDINRGTREMMADAAQATVDDKVRNRQEAGAEGAARAARNTAFTQMLVAHRAGEVDSLAEDKEANWEMRTPGEPKVPPEDHSSRVKTNYFLMSGRSNIRSVARQAGKPEVGQQIVRKLMSYLASRAGYAGEWTSKYEKILRDNGIKSREQHRVLWDVKEGKLPPPTQQLAKAAQQVTELMNEIRRRAAEKGLYLQDYDDDGRKVNIYYANILDNPSYMPHIHDYNEKIRVKDSLTGETHVFTLKQLLGGTLGDLKRDRILAAIERETGVSRYEVEKRLKNRQRKTPLAGNLERARSADLPFYRKDKGAMVKYFESAGELFARADEIGQEREKFNGLVAQIPNSNARKVIDTIADSLLKPRPWDQSAGKMYSRLAAAEVITKMVFSPIKVPFHLVHSGLLLEQYRPVIKGLFMTALNYREMRERAIFSGALMEQVRAELMLEQGTDLKLAHQFLTASGFNSLYKLDRIIANTAAQQWMENYALPKLIKNGKNALHIREQLKNKLLMEDGQIDAAIKAGRWTNEDLAHGGVALANKAMFTNDPTELPPAWRARADDPVSDSVNMALRAATVLKSFTFKTAAILKEQLIDEARRGNFRPWIPFLLAYPIAGEALRLTAATGRTVAQKGEEILTGSEPQDTALDKYSAQLQGLFDDPSVARLANRWLDDVASATGLTMFSHVMDVLFFPSEEKRKARFQAGQLAKDELEEIAGPIYGDIWNLFESLFDVTSAATIEEGEARQKKMSRAWRREIRQQFPLTRDFVGANPPSSYEMAPPP